MKDHFSMGVHISKGIDVYVAGSADYEIYSKYLNLWFLSY
jgi:hypothetical protein